MSEINKLSLKNVHKIDSVRMDSKIQTLIDEIRNDLDNQIRSEINLRSLDPIENILENFQWECRFTSFKTRRCE